MHKARVRFLLQVHLGLHPSHVELRQHHIHLLISLVKKMIMKRYLIKGLEKVRHIKDTSTYMVIVFEKSKILHFFGFIVLSSLDSGNISDPRDKGKTPLHKLQSKIF